MLVVSFARGCGIEAQKQLGLNKVVSESKAEAKPGVKPDRVNRPHALSKGRKNPEQGVARTQGRMRASG